MMTLLAKILKAFNSDARPIHIALGIGFALLIGFNSLFSLFGLIALIFLFVLRANWAVMFAMSAVFAGISILFDSSIASIGESLLTNPQWQSTLTALYQHEWIRLAKLNNTLVLGNAVISVIGFIPVVVLSQFLVQKYRDLLMAFVNKFKVIQSLKASKFYRIYQAVDSE